MSQRKVSEVLLKYSVDDSSLQKAVASNARLSDSYKAIAAAARSYDLGAPEIEALGKASGLTTEEIAALTRELSGLSTVTGAVPFDAVSKGADTAAVKVGALTKRLEEAAKVSASTGDATGGLREAAFGGGAPVGNAGVVSGITTARNALIAAPGIGYQSPLVVGLRGLETIADKTGASVGQLGVGLGVAGIAVAVVAIALNHLNESLAESKRRLDGALQAQDAYYQAVQTLTTKEAQDRLAELEKARAAQELQLAETRAALDTGFQAIQTSVGGQVTFVGDALARIFDSQTGASDLRATAEEQQTTLYALNDEYTRLTQGLNANAFAANDAAISEEQLRKAREDADQALIGQFQRYTDLRLQLVDLRRTGTSDQVDAFVRGNSDQVEIIRNFLLPAVESLGLSSDAARQKTQDLNNQIDYLTTANELATKSVRPVIEAREAETRAIQEQLGAISEGISGQQSLFAAVRTASLSQVGDQLNALTEERRALETFLPELEKLAPTSQDAAQQLADARERLGQISSDYADLLTYVLPAAQARAYAEFIKGIGEAETQSAAKQQQIIDTQTEAESKALDTRNDAYVSAQEKRDDALTKLADDQAQKRQEIERKANATILTAVRARDALAAFNAIQQKKQDLADLQEQGKTRIKEIDKQLSDQQKVADKAYDKSIRAAQDNAAKSIRIEQQRLRDEINAKTSAYQQQLSALSQFNQIGTQQVANFATNATRALEDAATYIYNRILAQLPVVLPPVTGYQPAGGGGAGGGGGVYVTPYASGGLASGLARVNDGGGLESALNYRTNQLMLLTEPTRIFSAPMTQRMLQGGKSSGLTINLGGVHGTQWSRRKIVDVFDKQLDANLASAGWE